MIRQILKNLFHNRIFTRLMAFYLMLLLFILMVCGFTYVKTMELTVANAIERNSIIFENASTVFQNVYDYMDQFMTMLYRQEYVQRMMLSTQPISEQVVDIYNCIHKLPAVNDFNGIIGSYYIYFAPGDYAVAPGKGFSRLSLYYDEYFSLSDAQPFDDWYEEVILNDSRSVHGEIDGNGLQFVYPISTFLSGAKTSKVIYTINQNSLLSKLSDALPNNEGYAVISDLSNHILETNISDAALRESVNAFLTEEGSAGQNKYHLIDGEKYLISTTVIPNFGIQASILVPASALQSQARQSIRDMLRILAVLLIVGIAAIVIAVIYNVPPLVKISEQLSRLDHTDINNLWQLPQAISQIENNWEEAQRQLSERNEQIRMACLTRLIHGTGFDPYELEEMLKTSNIELRGTEFCAVYVLLNYETPQAADTSSPVLNRIFNEHSDHLTLLLFESQNLAACLFYRQDEEPIDIKAFFTDIYKDITSSIGVGAEFYIGTVCHEPEQIAVSFDTAEWQMMVSQHSEWISFAQDNVGSADLKTILPQESAKQLENLVIAGDKEAMRKKLEQIREDYFVKRRLHGFQRQYLYCRLVSQLAAFNIEASDRKRIPDKLLDMGDEAFFEWLTKQFMECCDIVSRQNEKRTEKLIRSILDTIGENYGDYDLSLNSLAIQFGITTSYLSGLFKKETGMNFSAYLEQFRIEKSESLMQQSDRTIDEISQMVGYGNSDSFRRAYRRIRGISPSQYRTSAKQALS